MGTIYFTDGKHSPRQLPQNAEYLDTIIHASFLPKLKSGVSREIRTKAKVELSNIQLFERVLLGDLVPTGNPFLVDAGHNGYTWQGKREDYELHLEGFEGKKRELLMSSGFIGSSSHVYIPMIDVIVNFKKSKEKNEEGLPQFMMYDLGGYFKEARYDISEGSFVPQENAREIYCNSLKMLHSPKQKSDYLKDNRLTHVPFDYFKMNEYNTRCPLIGGISLIGAAIAGLTKMVVFRGMNMSSFEEQVMNYFTLKGQILRQGTRGYEGQGWISEEQLQNFSYATMSELEEGARALEREKWPHLSRKLNKFLLYKAFEKQEGREGSFIVGGIEGDDHTLHLPYVKVGLRG